MPRRPRDPALRQRSNTPAPPVTPEQLRVAPAETAATWEFPATQRTWDAFWRSPLALYVIEPDLPQLRRLHEYYDERERLRQRVPRRSVTTRGSTKQMVLHPIYERLDAIDEKIEKLEDRYGLGLDARRRLNIDLSKAPGHDAHPQPALRAIK
jgi:hypothetical protein